MKKFFMSRKAIITLHALTLTMWLINGVVNLSTEVSKVSYGTMWVALLGYILLTMFSVWIDAKQEESTKNLRAISDDLIDKYKTLNEAWRQTALRFKAQVPEWILTSERMPEPNVAVIIHVTNDAGWECVEFDIYDGEKWLDNCDDEQHHVTHWMPAPKWPEEDEND